MNNSEAFLKQLLQQHELELRYSERLFGGDINEVYKLNTSEGELVVKLNDATRFPGMFEAEKEGLGSLANSDSFRIPATMSCGEYEDKSFLLMEYISPGKPSSGFWQEFASQLAALHSNSEENFGYPSNNYIGSLPQFNKWENTASEFYINQRLEPQFKLAYERGFSFQDLNSFFKSVERLIPNDAPALVHGDLWNGNYMVDQTGQPVLIDPAVSYSIREMDLAMMKLFGGFAEEAYEAYDDHFPLKSGWQERIPLYQLYYLLVHLNLFGSGYLGQVRSILGRFS